MYNEIFGGGLPMGFSMSLMQNLEAYNRFSRMNERQKRCVIEGTHSITSRAEMNEYIRKIANGEMEDW